MISRLEDEAVDSPIGAYSGAELSLETPVELWKARTAYNLMTGEDLKDVNVEAVRGMEGVRTGEFGLGPEIASSRNGKRQ